jgi:hypothetical protein
MKTVLTTLALAIMLAGAHPQSAAASWWPWSRHHHSCGCEQVDKCGVKSYSKCNKCNKCSKCDPCDKCGKCNKCEVKVEACAPPPPVEKCHYVTDIAFDECGRKLKTKHVECAMVQPKAKCSKCGYEKVKVAKCSKCGACERCDAAAAEMRDRDDVG